jgi:hypothetical protein
VWQWLLLQLLLSSIGQAVTRRPRLWARGESFSAPEGLAGGAGVHSAGRHVPGLDRLGTRRGDGSSTERGREGWEEVRQGRRRRKLARTRGQGVVPNMQEALM